MSLDISITPILGSGVRYAVPLVLAAMGGLMSERSGTVDIGLEGKMLIAAFAAATTAALLGTDGSMAPLTVMMLSVLAAIAASTFFAMLHGFATISQKSDHTISGLAINILASGLTMFLGHAIFKQGGQTPLLNDNLRFTRIVLPGAEAMKDIPFIGPFYSQVISGHYLLAYIAVLAVAATSFILFRTRLGLHIRAVGEEPNAVDTAGLSVNRLRYTALLWTGLMCGLAGVTLSMAQNGGFVREMSAGMGYMALAAVIFGKWRPWQTLLACFLFGLSTALSDALSGRTIAGVQVPSQFFNALPYILTVILLAGFVGKSIAPKAVGRPYVKER